MNQKNEMLFKKILEEARNKYNNQAMLIQMEEYCQQIGIHDHILYIVVNSADLYDFLQDIDLTKLNEIATLIYQDKIEVKFVQDFDEYERIIKEENKKLKLVSSKLNKNLTFSTYIVGEYNKVHTDLLNKIINDDKVLFNPIFIYGMTGVGKTHLVNAFAIEYLKKFPERKLKLITADVFSRDCVNLTFQSGNNKRIEEFKKENCSYDVYIIEDIQFMVSKEKTQEIFFNIFENLISNNSLIIITSDRFHEHLNHFTDRLISRFGSGVTLEMKSPGEEVTAEIIKERLKEFDLTITDEALDLLMKHYTLDIRKLLGALNNISIYATIENVDLIDINNLKKFINYSGNNSGGKDYYTLNLNPQSIINTVAKYYGIKPNELVGKTQTQKIVNARSMAMFIMKEKLNLSYESIGDYFNKKHPTVIHNVENFRTKYQENDDIKLALDAILKKL